MLEQIYPYNNNFTMPRNVQEGLAPLYNEMLNPPTYGEPLTGLEPMTELEKEFRFKPKENKNNFTKGLFQFLAGALIPGGSFLFGDKRGLAGLGRRLQNTDFAQAKTLADYFDMQRYGGLQGRLDAAARNMAQARGIQNQMALRASADVDKRDIQRGGAGSAAEAAKKTEAKKASRSAGIAAARGADYGSRLRG